MDILIFTDQNIEPFIKLKDRLKANFHVLEYAALPEIQLARSISVLLFYVDIRSEKYLSHLREFKERCPSIPIILVGVQFFDHIVLWALRNHILDYVNLASELDYLFFRLNDYVSRKSPRGRVAWLSSITKTPRDALFKTNEETKRTDIVMAYIQSNLPKKLKISELAKLCNITSETLSRVFKQENGITVQDYIRNSRLDRARQYLLQKPSTIQSIAFDVGYENIALFNRLFKKNYGLTPNEYRSRRKHQDTSVLSSNIFLFPE